MYDALLAVRDDQVVRLNRIVPLAEVIFRQAFSSVASARALRALARSLACLPPAQTHGILPRQNLRQIGQGRIRNRAKIFALQEGKSGLVTFTPDQARLVSLMVLRNYEIEVLR